VFIPLTVVVVLAVVFLAPPFVETLYLDRFHAAGWMAQLLCASVWFGILRSTTEQGLLTLGMSRGLAAGNVACLVGTMLACALGYWLAGLGGFILGYAVGSLVGYLTVQTVASRHGLSTAREDCGWSLLVLGLALLGVLLPEVLGSDTGATTAASLGLPLALLVGCGVWAARRARKVLFKQ
jgi:O-antigen/teichoic acid export membrane protein